MLSNSRMLSVLLSTAACCLQGENDPGSFAVEPDVGACRSDPASRLCPIARTLMFHFRARAKPAQPNPGGGSEGGAEPPSERSSPVPSTVRLLRSHTAAMAT